MKKMIISLFVLAVSLAFAGAATAAQTLGALNVTADVVVVCTVSTSPVNFGSYSGTQVTALGDVSVTCTSGSPYNIALDAGQNFDGISRRLSDKNQLNPPLPGQSSSGGADAFVAKFGFAAGAADHIRDLINLVKSFNVNQGIENSLDAKLQNVQKALEAAQGGDLTSTCNLLNAFISEVQAQSGKAITAAQADQLIAKGTQIKAVLGCL